MVSPHFPPQKTGLSDYSFKFYEELKKVADVKVSSGDSPQGWKGLSLIRFFLGVLNSREDTLLIQYVPYMYGKRGMNLQFPLLIFIYSLFKRKKIQVMVHEFNYPYLGDFKSLLLYCYHQLMGRLLLLASDEVFCTTEHFKFYLQPKCLVEVLQLPVGSNIQKSEKETEILKKLNLRESEFACIFGNFHSSKDLSFVISELKKTDYQVIHIGANKEDYQKNLSSVPQNIYPIGYLLEEEVSELLSKTKLLLCYFLDGATLRRGSLLAGIEHNTPILVNKSKNTEKELLNCENISFAKDKTEFRELLESLLKAPKRQFANANPFSWELIVKKYLSRRIG
tara:strand:+ start:71354 stop:72367 length:1014 start_codon:yes stop_codon:yes gene_type:complete